MSNRTALTIGFALLLLVGIMAYGWGQAQAKNREYRSELKAARDSIAVQLQIAKIAGWNAQAHVDSADDYAANIPPSLNDLLRNQQRRANERTTLDTAGAAYVRSLVLWTNPH